MEEVAKHNKEEDAWTVLDGVIYDITGYGKEHPGGKKAIDSYAGKDMSNDFSKEFNNV